MFDENDKKILNLYIQNPSILQKEIAKEIGLTPPAIYNRIQRMKEQKIILGFAPIIDLQKIGYDLTTVINIKVKNGKSFEAAQKWSQDPHVCATYDITGEHDLALIAKFHNTKELNTWNKTLLKDTEFIERVNTSLALNTHKEGTNPKIE